MSKTPKKKAKARAAQVVVESSPYLGEETSLLIWDIPTDLKRAFKAKCAENQQTMRDVILAFLKSYAS